MASIGLNVARDGTVSPKTIADLGATWLRIVATAETDLTDYLNRCRAAGLKILLVLARESFTVQSALTRYRDRYGPLVDAVQVGNEPDLVSPSSWTLAPGELAALGRDVRRVFQSMPLVCAGLASGQPEWLDGMDLTWCDALAIHPYAKDAENPADLEDQPDVQPLLREYRRFGKPLLVTEWGWPSDEQPRAAQEVWELTDWAAGTSLIDVLFHFCASDTMVPPFGLLSADGSEKPQAGMFRKAASHAIASAWPAAATPEPEKPRPVVDPWQWFSVDQLATTTNCPPAAVREHWPRLVEQLTHCGNNSRSTQIALAATVAIETAHTFAPVREAFWLSEEWRRANLRYYPHYGRGFIQLTWAENYRSYGQKVDDLWQAGGAIDLVARPDDALDPDISAAVAAVYFRDHGGDGLNRIPQAATIGNWAEVRRLVQGSDAGLEDFTQMATALWALPLPSLPAPAPPAFDKALVAKRLREILALHDETAARIHGELAALLAQVEEMAA